MIASVVEPGSENDPSGVSQIPDLSIDFSPTAGEAVREGVFSSRICVVSAEPFRDSAACPLVVHTCRTRHHATLRRQRAPASKIFWILKICNLGLKLHLFQGMSIKCKVEDDVEPFLAGL